MGRKPAANGGAAGVKNAMQRVKRELQEYNRNLAEHSIYHMELAGDSVFDLRGHIYGPQDSPFQGGIFRLEIKVPETYPFNPPKMKFTTRLWHPNVSSQTGAICLDILKDQWAASLTIRTVMLSLQALLTSPEPDDPQDAMVARQFKETPDMYKKTASYWTYFYAIENKSEEMARTYAPYEALIRDLMMRARCDRSAAMSALSCHQWVLSEAIKFAGR